MRRRKIRIATTLATVAALAVVAGACGSSSKSTSSAGSVTAADNTTTTVPKLQSITVTAGDYAYTGIPATLDAGVVNVTFVNKGQVAHEMTVLKVADNSDTAPVFTALGKAFDGGPLPATFLAVNGVHDTAPGKTTVTQFNLTPGSYIALCGDTGVVGSSTDGQPHFMRGMYKKITVTGTGGAVAPTAAVTLTAHDYSFDVSQLRAGTQTIAFKNAGPTQWHFADINVFPKGTTVAQATAALPKLFASNGAPPAGVPAPEEVVGSQAASPGNGNTFVATLEKGRTYVVLCFLSDKTGGPPHAIGHHMYKVFTVS
jgi:plastocyanin